KLHSALIPRCARSFSAHRQSPSRGAERAGRAEGAAVQVLNVLRVHPHVGTAARLRAATPARQHTSTAASALDPPLCTCSTVSTDWIARRHLASTVAITISF
ncbi:MAG TPA: hypothetical protein VH138_07840, partial [Vicinamibacterales bacterium]|nr:hypothetical protein [Vicinamibacterales bacterium]